MNPTRPHPPISPLHGNGVPMQPTPGVGGFDLDGWEGFIRTWAHSELSRAR